MKQDTDIGDGELLSTSWFQLSNTLDVHIAGFSTLITYHMMVVFNIWIKPCRPNTDVDELQLTHLGKFLECLIHGSK